MGGYAEAHKSFEELQKHTAALDIVTDTIEIAGKFGPTIVTLVRAKALLNQQLPMVFYTHGGGWILGR
jgi:acetyl esterase/lipase